VQPVLIDRYALPTLAGLAPVLLFALYRPPARPWLLAGCSSLVIVNLFDLAYMTWHYRHRDKVNDELIEWIRSERDATPVVFELTQQLYVVCHYAPELTPRCYYLDFEAGEIGSQDNNFRRFNRDLARAYTTHYSGPALMKWSVLQHLSRRYVVPDLAE